MQVASAKCSTRLLAFQAIGIMNAFSVTEHPHCMISDLIAETDLKIAPGTSMNVPCAHVDVIFLTGVSIIRDLL